MWLDDFRAQVEAHPHWRAAWFQGRDITYRELWDRSAVAGLQACQEHPGPRHLIAHASPLATIEAMIGAWIHGKVPVVVAPNTPTDMLQRLRERIAQPPPAQDVFGRSEALIIGTSGSTGNPKLVVLPHDALRFDLEVVGQWYGQPAQSRVLVGTGVHGAASLMHNVLLGLINGWDLHLYPAGTPGSVLQAHIRAHDIHVTTGPASYYRLFFQYGSDAPFPSLRHVSSGGERVPWSLVQQIHAAFPAARTFTTYGLTEAGVRVSALSTRDPHAAEGCCGVPVAYLETRIAPVEGVAAPAGELRLRGPTVFLGYLQEDGSYAGLDVDGFYRTGDLLRPDAEGYLHYQGRLGRLVKVGGFLVNPSDVEQVLLSFPDVAEALCWAEPHPLLGFALAAEVVPEPGADLDAKTLQRLCLTRLERHQMPRTVSIVDRLPDTPGGKRRLSPMSRHVAG